MKGERQHVDHETQAKIHDAKFNPYTIVANERNPSGSPVIRGYYPKVISDRDIDNSV